MPTSDIKKGPLYVDSTNNSVGIGTTTNNQSSSTASVTLNAASGMSAYELRNADVFSGYVGNTGTNMYLVNAKNGSLGLYTNNTERMHLTSTGNVGIGTSSPSTSHKLTLEHTSNYGGISLKQSGTQVGQIIQEGGTGNIYIDAGSTDANGSLVLRTNFGSERMRIDSGGNVLVGTTSTSLVTTSTETGAQIYDGGFVAAANDPVAYFNRITSDGMIAQFRKDGTIVGSIGARQGDLTIGTGASGLHFYDVASEIFPVNINTNTFTDGTVTLGDPLVRFKDLYLSGGVYLGGTGSANKLDEYEFGSWLPNIHKGGSALASSSKAGRYLRTGNVVHLWFYWFSNIGVTTSGGNSWTVQNLPFSVLATNGNFISGGYIGINGTAYGNTSPYRWQANASTYLELYGTQGITNTSSGYTEFSGAGTLYLGT